MKKLAFLSLFFALSTTALAYSGDMAIDSQNISFSKNNFLEGNTVRIYATATNSSGQDLLGIVRFYDNGNQISSDQAISIFSGASDGVFIDWTPLSPGTHKIDVKITPWRPEIDDPSNNSITTNISVIQDTDHDGIPNTSDPDDDNDGVIDTEDHFPTNASEQFDTDGDGKGDNTDLDDDNDGVPDEFDDLPLDPNESIDTDHDGIGNTVDADDDNDGLDDAQEENIGTNHIKYDTDDDGLNDKEDAFPLDPNESLDTDFDSIGNNTDTDDDNDGIDDQSDEFPLNVAPAIHLKDEGKNLSLYDKHIFDASPSYDPDGKIVNFLWKIDGVFREGTATEFTFKDLGNHEVELTVTDDQGQSITKSFQVNVSNMQLYIQMGISLFVLLLALFIYFKYIAEAKNSKDEKRHTS